MIDVPGLNAQLFARAATDAAGATLRGLLGSGGNSVITARELSKKVIPLAPLIAWRRMPIAGESGEMRLFVGIWYVYDLPAQGYWRINQVANALQALYVGWALPYGELTNSIGGEQMDETLGLLVTPVRVSYSQLS